MIKPNFIGIHGDCNFGNPESGLYISDLPGVSLRKAAGLAEGTQIWCSLSEAKGILSKGEG